jgi:hypothetical protein
MEWTDDGRVIKRGKYGKILNKRKIDPLELDIEMNPLGYQ